MVELSFSTAVASNAGQGGLGEEIVVDGDVCVMATGFHRPGLKSLLSGCFAQLHGPPNWYLRAFPVGHPEICVNNCTYVNALRKKRR